MIEFALIFPIVLMITFGIMEISLCMASLVTLEGGLKEASRYGITSQSDAPPDTNKVPTAFKVGNDNRLMTIGYILNQNTLDLIDLNAATITTQVYSSFSAVKDGEPYSDLNSNGVYNTGEPYSDTNCNGVRDGAGAASSGVGAAGNIVVYTVNYNWKILTPIIGQWLGKPDPSNPGRYMIPMSSSIVVKNEPNLSGSSFCKS
ncbi:TadE/TadG family type IV pilus assembly protein [Dongia sp.]|uniref:TadE/TadG family type IV pilus assembly protein n=1 Tax=Dongia sp. TaxID=1977262 RepID=UPI003750D402